MEGSFTCRCKARSDRCVSDGGVSEPEVGAVPLLPSDDPSVECSVRKLALDRLLSSLKLKREGAMAPR